MNSFLLPDKYKLHLTKDELFDRIINVKLYVKKSDSNALEEFIIRSDYEAVFKNQTIQQVLKRGTFVDGAYYIRKCTYKPSIKFTYTRVSTSSDIEMDLYISNFLIFSSDGKVMANFNKSDYDLVRVEIMMGYWGQFRDMPHATLDDLYTFEPMFGADKISMNNVEYVQTDSLPPDYVLHIHGYVGNVLDSPADEEETQPTTYEEAISSEEVIETSEPEESSSDTDNTKSDLAQIFEKQITKNFYPVSKIIMDNGTVATVGNWSKGVIVYLSDEAKAIKLKGLRDKDGNIIQRKTYFKKGESLGNAMTKVIQAVAPKSGLTFSLRNDGNVDVFVLAETKDVAQMAENKKKNDKKEKVTPTVFEAVYDNTLPAVYNINIDEVATIVCPFFAFINPFDLITFKYRYNTSNLVSYYASTSTERDTFINIRMQISFATVDNINEMQLYCITM